MTSDDQLPRELTINASEGRGTLKGATADSAEQWVLETTPPPVRPFLAPPKPADPVNWSDERVGWGLIVQDRDDFTEQQKIDLADVDQPIRDLVADREKKIGKPVPVFRYRAKASDRFRLLRDYRNKMDVAITGSPQGVAAGSVPRYLLIHGSPKQVPWQLQYILNTTYAVGRLDLTGDALGNYVRALLADWKQDPPNANRALIWSVDLGEADITRLMRDAIAAPLHGMMAGDRDIGANAVFIDGTKAPALKGELIRVLGKNRPAVVVTTSHGRTGPLNDVEAMKTSLGLLEDQNFEIFDAPELTAAWDPYGTIWYAHACCSAGSDENTIFDSLFEASSDIARVLNGVSKTGPMVSPLPTALLGHSRPIRAFVGHVEPTFDYTIRDPRNGQDTTAPIHTALYNNLFQPWPIGLAFGDLFGGVGTLFSSYEASVREFNRGGNTQRAMFYSLLAARDIVTSVILGDPTTSPRPLTV